jgi:hypothetical protein
MCSTLEGGRFQGSLTRGGPPRVIVLDGVPWVGRRRPTRLESRPRVTATGRSVRLVGSVVLAGRLARVTAPSLWVIPCDIEKEGR